MKSYEMDLSTGSLWKKALIFSVPLMFSNILQVLFNMSDIAVVGKFSGPIALGAVGSTSLLITLFTGILIGLASGVNALTALYIGSKHERNIKSCVHSSFVICLGAGILITLFGEIFTPAILRLMNTKEELIGGAVLYLRIYLLGAPALGLYNFGNAVLSAAGDTKRPLYCLLFSGILNVVLNLFFVIVCGMDVAGVGLASIISQYISAILVVGMLVKSKASFAFHLRNVREYLDSDKMRRVLSLGVPAAFQNTLFAIANLFVQASVNSFDHVMVEGNSAAANADPLVYDMMAAFYTAGTSFIAQNLGAGKKDRILKSYLICTGYAFVLALLLGVGIYVCRYGFLGIFTNDPDVVAAGIHRLSIMALSYAISAFMDGTIAASRGLGKTVVPTIVVILGSCVFRLAWVYTVFAHFHTIRALYLLYPVSWSITAAAEIAYFIKVYRQMMREDG